MFSELSNTKLKLRELSWNKAKNSLKQVAKKTEGSWNCQNAAKRSTKNKLAAKRSIKQVKLAGALKVNLPK